MERSHERSAPWYREPWPWLLAAGPLIVVVASLWSAWIAVKTSDGVVAEDYYKRGLAINRELEHLAANAQARLGATLRVADNGEIRVRMEGMSDLPSEAPARIRLTLAHPTRSAHDLVIILTRDTSGEYSGMLGEQTPGRWIVTLDSEAWRLPTTTVPGRLTETHLGAANGRS